jgi:sigma-E factor negative regulatory protein RseA
MTTYTDEGVSALVDGELNGAEKRQALDDLCKDVGLRDRWARYHLISDALKRNLPPSIPIGFSNSVMQAIAIEPSILAAPKPASSTVTAGGWSGKIAVFNRDVFMKKVSGAAIAASVAAIALISYQVGLQQQVGPDQANLTTIAKTDPTQNNEVAVVNSVSPGPQIAIAPTSHGLVLNPAMDMQPQGAMQASSKSSTFIPDSSPSILMDAQQAQLNQQLSKYIFNHNQHFSGTRFQGLIPYARIIATPRNSEQNPHLLSSRISQAQTQIKNDANNIGQQ